MSTQIVFTITDILSTHQTVHVGGTTLPMFGQNGKLKRGKEIGILGYCLLILFINIVY
jgi:hypothetical protein